MYVFTISTNLVAKLHRVQFKLAKQDAMENMSDIYNNLLLSSHEITLTCLRLYTNKLKKVNL